MFYKVIILVSIVTIILFLSRGNNFDKDTIKGRNVVVTGASSGIGEQLAYQYARLGANVFITARREHLLKQVIANCQSMSPHGRFGYHAANMADYKTESKVLIQKAVQFLDGIDTVIVNHVHIGHLLAWHGTAEELAMFEEMSAVNYNSYVHIASHALPYLKSAKQRRLGIVGSVTGKTPFPLMSSYCGSKFALDGFFSTLRQELSQAPLNITVTNAFLGVISTDAQVRFAMEEFKRLEIGPDSIIDAADIKRGDPEQTAQEIMQATETGQDELYYPVWFTTRILTMPAAWVPIMRHIWSKLTEILLFSEAFYETQEPSN